MATSDSTKESLIEVEQKFTLTLDGDENENDAVLRMEGRLQQLGLQPKGSMTLIDWYFDVEPDWPLTTRDHWLRYRQVILPSDNDKNGVSKQPRGSWQLKRGVDSSLLKRTTTSATVYEELAGDTAVETAVAMLVHNGYGQSTRQQMMDGQSKEELWKGSSATLRRDVPQLPEPSYGLVPFARIESKRSSWIVPSSNITSTPSDDKVLSSSWSHFAGLSVDLDMTTYGHAVGEVEIMVNHESEVAEARDRIQQFLTQLLDGNNNNKNTTTTFGKLEYYLSKYRPDHYQACLQNGSLVASKSHQ